MTQRALILIGRHGSAPKNPDGSSVDTINPESIGRMYEQARSNLNPLVEELGITPADTFLRWTGRVRTLYSGKAKASGALNLARTDASQVLVPASSEDLANYNWEGIAVEEDIRLNFGRPFCNMPVYKATGGEGNVDFWLANPTARMHEGAPIESYDSVEARTGYAAREAIRRVTHDGKRFGIVTTHNPVAEPALIHLINSARNTPVERIGDIGGTLKEEEHALLTIDKTDGGIYTATLSYKGVGHKVDLQNLLKE